MKYELIEAKITEILRVPNATPRPSARNSPRVKQRNLEYVPTKRRSIRSRRNAIETEDKIRQIVMLIVYRLRINR